MENNVKINVDKYDDNYNFFNKDSFQKRFKNLLAFVCLIGSLKNDDVDITIKEMDYSYLFEKYEKYISLCDITEEEKTNVILFASNLKKIPSPDILIYKWNKFFGEDAFFKISTEPNYRIGLHVILKKNLFEVYMNNLFHTCKEYKIWRKYKIIKLLQNEKSS